MEYIEDDLSPPANGITRGIEVLELERGLILYKGIPSSEFGERKGLGEPGMWDFTHPKTPCSLLSTEYERGPPPSRGWLVERKSRDVTSKEGKGHPRRRGLELK